MVVIKNFANKSYPFKNSSLRISKIKSWFTHQSSQPQETEDRINLTFLVKFNLNLNLVKLNDIAVMKMRYSIEPRDLQRNYIQKKI